MAMFSVSLRRDDNVRHYSVDDHGAAGWEIKAEENRTLTRHVWYHDWHRVERMLALFHREVADLTESGWTIQSPQ
jgi:hypothetical protein